MREFALTQTLLERALKEANARRIKRVNLLIGAFSEQREESIQFYWRDLAKGSNGEGAVLHFEHANVHMKCLDCTGTFYLDENQEATTCKYCDDEHVQFLSGEDVRLQSIEVE